MIYRDYLATTTHSSDEVLGDWQWYPTRGHHERMMYFTNVGALGGVRYHQIPRSIAVMKLPRDG
jgi:hypothetical protein